MENYKGFTIELLGVERVGKKLTPTVVHQATKDEWNEGDPIYHGTLEEVKEEIDIYWASFESDEEEDNFNCCSDCDLPDACSDFGCAIEQGIKRKPEL